MWDEDYQLSLDITHVEKTHKQVVFMLCSTVALNSLRHLVVLDDLLGALVHGVVSESGIPDEGESKRTASVKVARELGYEFISICSLK